MAFDGFFEPIPDQDIRSYSIPTDTSEDKSVALQIALLSDCDILFRGLSLLKLDSESWHPSSGQLKADFLKLWADPDNRLFIPGDSLSWSLIFRQKKYKFEALLLRDNSAGFWDILEDRGFSVSIVCTHEGIQTFAIYADVSFLREVIRDAKIALGMRKGNPRNSLRQVCEIYLKCAEDSMMAQAEENHWACGLFPLGDLLSEDSPTSDYVIALNLDKKSLSEFAVPESFIQPRADCLAIINAKINSRNSFGGYQFGNMDTSMLNQRGKFALFAVSFSGNSSLKLDIEIFSVVIASTRAFLEILKKQIPDASEEKLKQIFVESDSTNVLYARCFDQLEDYITQVLKPDSGDADFFEGLSNKDAETAFRRAAPTSPDSDVSSASDAPAKPGRPKEFRDGSPKKKALVTLTEALIAAVDDEVANDPETDRSQYIYEAVAMRLRGQCKPD